MITFSDELLFTFSVKFENKTRELIFRGNDLFMRFGHRISDDNVKVIMNFLHRHPEFIGLDLSYNRITDKGMRYITKFLKRHTTLKKLNLMCNDITWPGIKQLANVGEQLSLESLRVNGNKFGPQGGKYLALLLACNSNLRHLDVAETDQTISSLVYFTAVLRHDQGTNETLQILDLGRPLGPHMHSFDSAHFAESLGQMLRYNTCLTELHLQKMNFSDHDIELLVLGLVYNRSLLLLDLCCNNIADDGTAHLGSYLKLGPPLRGLMLSHNRITDGGARFLSFTTPYSKLYLLDIAHNELTDAGILDILNSIKKAYPLGILYVWGNSITRTSCKIIRRMLLSKVLQQEQLDVRVYTVDNVDHVAFNNVDRYKHIYYCLSEFGCALPKQILRQPCSIIPTQLIHLDKIDSLCAQVSNTLIIG